MTGLGALARLDVVLAWRRGVVGAAVAVVLFYVVVLQMTTESVAATLLPYLVFSDPAALGFFFVGGIVLAERAEGTAAAVAVSPVPLGAVLAARILVLAALGSASGLAVALGSGVGVDWLTFAPAVVLTALLYTSFGFTVATRSATVNEYFARATVWSVPLFAPLAAFAAEPDAWVMTVWPTTAALVLLEGAEPSRAIPAFVVLAVATAIVVRWARAALETAHREGRV